MKTLSFAIMLTALFATSAQADARRLLSVFAPTAVVAYPPVMSSAACSRESNPELCALFVTASHAITSLSTAALLKEEIRTVEVDAYDFLAGDPMTLALEEVVRSVRAEVEGLEELSDEVVVTLMLSSL